MSRVRSGDFDITKNIRVIEWLKCQILNLVAEIFNMLASGAQASQEALARCLGKIIINSYLLGKRLGIHYALIDQAIEDQLRLEIIEDNDIEQSYGDLSELQQHLRDSRTDL